MMGRVNIKSSKSGFYKSKKKLPVKFKEGPGWPADLKWTQKEEENLVSRIFNLRYDQVAALSWLVGVRFERGDLERIFYNIKEDNDWINIMPIIYEADSKENLLWWLDFFEKANKKKTSKK